MACTSLKVNIEQRWYFNSGISRHMTGNKDLLTDIWLCNLKSVTLGDGVKGGDVLGSGLLKVSSMPKLDNVLL